MTTITSTDPSVVVTPESPATPAAPIMTQEQLNDRLARKEESVKKSVFELLGVTNEEEAKALAQTAKTLLAAKQEADLAALSEIDRLKATHTEQLGTLTTELETTKAALATIQTQQRRSTVEQAIVSAAKRANDPTDVVMWATAQKDILALIDEEGKVKQSEIDKLIKECEAAKPAWFKSVNPGSLSNAGGRPPQTEVNLTGIYKPVGW